MTEYISDVRRVFDGRLAMYSFHDYDFGNDQLGRFRGGYRAANKEITIEFHATSIFIGTCKPEHSLKTLARPFDTAEYRNPASLVPIAATGNLGSMSRGTLLNARGRKTQDFCRISVGSRRRAAAD